MDLEAFRWLLTDDGQQLLGPRRPTAAGRPAARRRPRSGVRRPPEHVAAALTQVELRPRGRGEVRRPGRADVLHPRRARAGHPAAGRHAPGRPAARRVGGAPSIDLGCGIGGDLVALRPGRAHRAPASTSTRSGSAVAEANLAALGLAGAVQVADATTVDTAPFDGGVRRPGPPHRAAAGPSTSTTGRRRGRSSRRCCARDACVKVAPGIPHDLVPARRRGRVGQRPRRGQGGRALVGPARHRPAPGHGDRRRRAGHAHRRGRPGRADGARRSAGSSTSPTAP